MQFAEVASQVRTWPAKDQQKLAYLIERWADGVKPKGAKKPNTAAPVTETDAVVKKMRLRKGDGSVAGDPPAQ